jgi:hypothetical protein
MKKRNSDTEDEGWGLDDVDIDWKQYEKNIKKYNAPIEKHICDGGCVGRYKMKDYHEKQLIWDDFELSQKQREKLHMEIIRVKGREFYEKQMVRRYATSKQPVEYVIRLSIPTQGSEERLGDLYFENEEDQTEMFNHIVRVFGFTTVELIGSDPEPWLDDDDDEWQDPEDKAEPWDIDDDDALENW